MREDQAHLETMRFTTLRSRSFSQRSALNSDSILNTLMGLVMADNGGGAFVAGSSREMLAPGLLLDVGSVPHRVSLV